MNFAKKLLIQEAIKSILQNIGEDINREGLIKTPERVCKSYSEMFNGYGIDIAKIFEAQFTNENNNKNIILIKKIEYKSMCEHHMLPVIGYANIAYIPNEKVLGLSKFTRIVHAFSNRLQLQERMTKQIIDAIMQYLNPLGVAVHLSAKHYCMIMRGVKQVAEVDTFDFDGIFLEENYQNKFLQLIK
ncbi:MAG: GTP cyclohydrolase I FolE [Rickettsiales bacterium]